MLVLDENVVILAALVARAVEHRAIGKNDSGHRRRPEVLFARLGRIAAMVEAG